jgi:serine/threonine protein kinase
MPPQPPRDRKPGVQPTVQQGKPDAGRGTPTRQQGERATRTGVPTTQQDEPASRRGVPTTQQGGPADEHGASTRQQGVPTWRQGPDAPAEGNGAAPFPAQLTARYTPLTRLGHGTEGVVWRCSHIASDDEVAVKVYYLGRPIDEDLLCHLDDPRFRAHVPKIVEYGTVVTGSGAFGWVAMEYFAQDLQQWLTTNSSGHGLPAATARQVLLGLAAALRFWQDTVDRNPLDFKPDNVMIRERPGKPPQYVIVDFGGVAAFTASQQYGGITMAAIAYTPPEEMWQEKRSPWPWWSLGEIAYLLITGHERFRRPDGTMQPDQVIRQDRVIGDDLGLREVEDERWRLLIRGLLTRDPADRWTWPQVEEWGAGGSPDVVRRDERVTPAEPAHRPITFGDGRTFRDPAELAAVMLRDWQTAGKWLAGGGRQVLLDWLTQEGLDKRFSTAHLRGISADPSRADQAILAFGAEFAPEVTPRWRGTPVDADGLLGLLASGASGLQLVRELAQNQVLGLAAGYRCAHGSCGENGCTTLTRAAANWQRLTDDAERGVPGPSEAERERLAGNVLWLLLAPEQAAAGLRAGLRVTYQDPDWWRAANARASSANPGADDGVVALAVAGVLAERAGAVRADIRDELAERRKRLSARIGGRVLAAILLFVATMAAAWIVALLASGAGSMDASVVPAANHAETVQQALAAPLLVLAVQAVLFGRRRPGGWLIGCCAVAAALGGLADRLPSFTAFSLPGFVTNPFASVAGLATSGVIVDLVGTGVAGFACLYGAIKVMDRHRGALDTRATQADPAPLWVRRAGVFGLCIVVLVSVLWSVGVLWIGLSGNPGPTFVQAATVMAGYQSAFFLALLVIAALSALAWPRSRWVLALGALAAALTAGGTFPPEYLMPLWHPVALPLFTGIAEIWGAAGCWAALIVYLPLAGLCVHAANRLVRS